MALVTPHAWVAGTDYGTAPSLNTLTDSISHLQGNTPSAGALDFCVLSQTIVQSLANGFVTTILFDTESADSANGHSTTVNTDRYTATIGGFYQVNAGVAFAANATGARGLKFLVNGAGTTGISLVPATTITTQVCLSRKVGIPAGGYLQVLAYQASGAALNTSYTGGNEGCFLDVQYLHP